MSNRVAPAPVELKKKGVARANTRSVARLKVVKLLLFIYIFNSAPPFLFSTLPSYANLI